MCKTKHRLLLFAFAFVLTATQTGWAQESKFAKLDGARVHYLNYGRGNEARVRIHGCSQNADAWRDNVTNLARRARVIVVELRCHGQSDKPEAQGQDERAKSESSNYSLYSMDHFARAVDAVMRDAKVKRAVLVGHSMGTPIARQFYRKYPEKTLAIVIVDGSLRPFGDKAVMDQMMKGFRGPQYRDVVNQMLVFISGP